MRSQPSGELFRARLNALARHLLRLLLRDTYALRDLRIVRSGLE